MLRGVLSREAKRNGRTERRGETTKAERAADKDSLIGLGGFRWLGLVVGLGVFFWGR